MHGKLGFPSLKPGQPGSLTFKWTKYNRYHTSQTSRPLYSVSEKN